MVSRVVNTIALMAAVVALGTCIWQEWGLFITLKRVILSYLGFFFLGSVMALAVKIVPFLDNSAGENEKENDGKRKHNSVKPHPSGIS